MSKKISVSVLPRSSKNEVIHMLPDGTLKVKLTAAPVDGEANNALIKLLAKHFNVSKRAVHIVKGETSKLKIVEIEE